MVLTLAALLHHSVMIRQLNAIDDKLEACCKVIASDEHLAKEYADILHDMEGN